MLGINVKQNATEIDLEDMNCINQVQNICQGEGFQI
jgi:hypothetical protein